VPSPEASPGRAFPDENEADLAELWRMISAPSPYCPGQVGNNCMAGSAENCVVGATT